MKYYNIKVNLTEQDLWQLESGDFYFDWTFDSEEDENVKIKTNVSNTKDEPVSAYIITQIKDSNNVTQHISRSTINIAPGKTGEINSEWIMKDDGVHTFEIFIWSSLWNQNPMSEPLILVI